MTEVSITKKVVKKLATRLGETASIFEDGVGRRYLEMRYDQLQESEKRAVAVYRAEDDVHFFYYVMPPNNRNPKTQEPISHPDSNETGGLGIQWWFLRIDRAWSIRYPTIDQADIFAQFTYSYHDTRRQSRARAGFTAARIQIMEE